MDAYRIATTEEVKAADCCEDYDLLLGPDGFECLLTEPEDRRWSRDGKGVISELNRLHAKATEPINMTVFIDENSNECLYVEGKAWDGRGERTVYVTDLDAYAKQRPILLQHIPIEGDWAERWPDDMDEVRIG